MSSQRNSWIMWIARTMSILLVCFVSVFALDVFSGGRPVLQTLLALAIHLVPAYILLAILILAWRRPWIGAVAYAILAAVYAGWARKHPLWVTTISGALLLTAFLFWLSHRVTCGARDKTEGPLQP